MKGIDVITKGADDNVKCGFIEPEEAGFNMDSKRLQTYVINNSYMAWIELVGIRFKLQLVASLMIVQFVSFLILAAFALVMLGKLVAQGS